MRPWSLVAVMAFALAACRTTPRAPGAATADAAAAKVTPPTGPVSGIDAIPAASRALVGVDVPRLAASPLVGKLLAALFARDPDVAHRLGDVLARCKIDPAHDLDQILIGMGADPDRDVVLVAHGRFDHGAVDACLRDEAAAAGGTITAATVAGRSVSSVSLPGIAYQLWITFGAPDTILVATSDAWLAQALAGKGFRTAPDRAAALARVDTSRTIWGVALLPPEASAHLVELAKGAIKPATSVSFTVDFTDGIDASAALEMPGEGDARTLADVARPQLDLLAVVAQKRGLGMLVNKIDVGADGRLVTLRLRLDRDDVARLAAALPPDAETGPDGPH